MTDKKVFISYSWSSPKHEDWVLDLANRLMQDGVNVILDKWDLNVGNDKYKFMEQMVHAQDINKVLLILDKKYTEKANERSGGVGTETTIISSEVYESVTQKKFIPIVAERSENGEEFIPTYLKSRIYIDLSSEEHYASEYEKLLREIYVRPSTAKPKLGKPPKYIYENTAINNRTTHILRSFDTQIDRHPERVNLIATDFLEEFSNNLKDFTMENKSSSNYAFGKNFVDNLTSLLPLRNDYIIFVDKLAKGVYNFDIDILVTFFEKLPSNIISPEAPYNWKNHLYQNFRFCLHELWLYTVALGLKRENYSLLEALMQSKYFTGTDYRSASTPLSYSVFYFHSSDFEDYYKKLMNQNLISCHAHLLMQRRSELVLKEELTNDDLFCYYISILSKEHWFPITYIYRKDHNQIFHFFNKLSSKKHFEKVKGVLGFDSMEDVVSRMKEVGQEKEIGYNNSFNRIPAMSDFIPVDSIGKHR